LESPVGQWLSTEAKHRLADTLAKLGLDAVKINGRHLSGFSADELAVEKKKVKAELKLYD